MSFSQWTSSAIILYLWHLINGLTHTLFESTYVYGCFRYSIPVPTPTPPQPVCTPSLDSFTPRFFLGRRDRLYGNSYGTGIFASLWQEYARADSRYAGIDVTTLSLEIITVFLAGPLALYVAESIRKDVGKDGRLAGRTWFCAGILAVGELYGGYVDPVSFPDTVFVETNEEQEERLSGGRLLNFLPEWLTANSSLRTDDALYL